MYANTFRRRSVLKNKNKRECYYNINVKENVGGKPIPVPKIKYKKSEDVAKERGVCRK